MPSAPIAGAAESALDFVIKKQNPLLVAQRAQGAEKIGGERTHTAFPLDGFDHDGCGAGSDGLGHAFEPRGDIEKSIHGRTESELHFDLSGGGDAPEGAPVERSIERDDLTASELRAVLPGEFVESFVGFGPAVAEKNFAARAGHFPQPGGEQGLRSREEKIRGVDEFAGLRRDGIAQRGVRMPEGIDRNARSEIEVFATLLIPDARAAPAGQSQREARVGRDDVPRIKFRGGG